MPFKDPEQRNAYYRKRYHANLEKSNNFKEA